MTPAAYYRDELATLYVGDCRAILPHLEPGSVDAVVTDPPYEIGLLGNAWDASGVSFDPEVWRACRRALKPGGHLLAFGAARTYHRLACAIEQAGFEIRDSIHWIYGQGFPKGVDIAKALDKQRDERDQVLTVTRFLAAARDAAGLTNRQIDAVFGFNGMARHWTTQGQTAAVPTLEQWERLRDLLGFDASCDALVAELNARKHTVGTAYLQREVVGHRASGLARGSASVFLRGTSAGADGRSVPVTAAVSERARAWVGWHTALKPAHEPIVVARKTTGYLSTAANLAKYGTGAYNIGATRTEDPAEAAGGRGRWPTNLVLGHGPDCRHDEPCAPGCPVAELNTAARYFPAFRYEPKAPARERPRGHDGQGHATVKPLALMRWLVRLVAAPGALVLDPFAGTGTTLQAALAEGMNAIGIEQDPDHAALARARLTSPTQLALA